VREQQILEHQREQQRARKEKRDDFERIREMERE
jgi:hypothetical protein